jgi:hypothetical protein
MEASGQHVQQEAAYELLGLKRHGLVARSSLGPVVLPTEGDATLVHREQATVRDRHAVGIARQVGEHRCGASKRALGIDHPFAFAQRGEPAVEGVQLGKRCVLAEELQAPAAM